MVLVSGMSAGPASAEEDVDIVVSPSTINIDLKGVWVTVHADIPFCFVDGASVTLNDIPVKATFADNRGDLVAKFVVGAVIDILVDKDGKIIDANPELELCGVLKDGTSFSGSDTIRVISSKK